MIFWWSWIMMYFIFLIFLISVSWSCPSYASLSTTNFGILNEKVLNKLSKYEISGSLITNIASQFWSSSDLSPRSQISDPKWSTLICLEKSNKVSKWVFWIVDYEYRIRFIIRPWLGPKILDDYSCLVSFVHVTSKFGIFGSASGVH